MHLIVGIVGILILVAAPFVMLRRLRTAPGWRDLHRLTLVVGISLIVALVANVALPTVQGLTQRAMALIACGWISALALHVLRLDVATHGRELRVPA